MTEQKHQLVAENLGKAYRSRWVVKDVSMEVKSGEIVGLLGPNGAGKTTSFYMIVGLIRPNKGVVKLNNQDITKYPIHWRARMGIGYLPQEASVFRKLSVEKNIMAILETRKELSKAERNDELDALLDEFNIQHIRSSLGMSLSGGERRRVEIARSLAMSPRFILLDEPFAGVDPISVIDIKKIITHLKNRGIGVLITDHNVRETLDICERAYIVNAGHMIASGRPRDILSNEQVRKVYLGEQFKM
ncbi:LPS export ABC transporter ATP-binding protein [Fangia hongkongensis]|uniref:LPS export ABC transporter ATP-binding protein n=1 Tax=Fangia hongkongensis TaxID=270495 RepID=UPI000373906B|nr:LPS export ABC transporter ATP-binding protein [Fangia hongkongensis]MBK2125134.1 LPS export ABC transporter ATP-binding protein [Fangia hongkongensis]